MILGSHRDVEDLRAATSIDLGFLAEEVVGLASLDSIKDYRAGLAEYEGARDLLDAASECSEYIGICAAIAKGRFFLARAGAMRARLRPPASPTPCFFDPAHGPADHFVAWTPEAMSPRTIPVCARDAAIVEADGQPEPRLVTHGHVAVPFWNAPDHFAYWFQGYFGQTEDCYPVRLLDGFPLGNLFAEPSGDGGVITSDGLFASERAESRFRRF